MNTFGRYFRLTSFGESHGRGIGGVIDGCPAGICVDMELIRQELNRRHPGQSTLTSSRKEADEVEFFSGIFEGKTTGTPIGFILRNTDIRSQDYDYLRGTFRPSHADYTYWQKYGIRDHRGGGRSSARETATRVVAGAFAKMILKAQDILIESYTTQIGSIATEKDYRNYRYDLACQNALHCPETETAEQMIQYIESLKAQGDSTGGIVTCVIKGVPAGWGDPVFDKLHALLGAAMLSIPACKAFEYGSGFDVEGKGSERNDAFYHDGKQIRTRSNYSGGIQGGISNGEDIYFRVAFKPVASIRIPQETVDKDGNMMRIEIQGRHDSCVLPRALPIVEAMAAMVLADTYLTNK